MTTVCYDWLTKSAKLTETTEASMASVMQCEIEAGAMPDMTAGERVFIFVIYNLSVPVA